MTLKATFTAAYPEARRIAEFLERDYGGAGAAVSLSDHADGTWLVEAYFTEGDVDTLGARLRDGLGEDGFAAPLRVEVLPDTNWVRASLADLAPVVAGRFVVHGSHDRGTIKAARTAIEIDANVAFGTGHHATTSGCLAVLDKLVSARRFRRPLDLGTGSGVLAIALAKTLNVPVLASDIDPQAVSVARANIALNGVHPWVRIIEARGVDHCLIQAGAPYDLVVANILAEPLCRLAPRLAPLIEKGGVLVLSGLLTHQSARVVAAYNVQRMRLLSAKAFDGWSALVLER